MNFYQGLRIGVAVKAFCISAVCFAFLVRGAGAEDGWGNLKTVTRDRRGALVSVDDQVLVLADFRGDRSLRSRLVFTARRNQPLSESRPRLFLLVAEGGV